MPRPVHFLFHSLSSTPRKTSPFPDFAAVTLLLVKAQPRERHQHRLYIPIVNNTVAFTAQAYLDSTPWPRRLSKTLSLPPHRSTSLISSAHAIRYVRCFSLYRLFCLTPSLPTRFPWTPRRGTPHFFLTSTAPHCLSHARKPLDTQSPFGLASCLPYYAKCP